MQERENKHLDYDLKMALIGGVAFSSAVSLEEFSVSTPYGDVPVKISKTGKHNIAVIQRHADGSRHIPPHMINYRANIYAIHELGINRVISTNSVGTMRNHPVGSFFLPNDFIDFTRNRSSTFFDESTVHVDVSEPYCPQIRKLLEGSLSKRNIGFSDGVYACTEGPRFETKAEIRMMRQFADVVGMTGLPEIVLAKELNMCYASICTVTNDACGLGKGKTTVSEVLDTLSNIQERLNAVLSDVIRFLPAKKECDCSFAASDGEL
ncbi:MAG: MTAP family purine nucleoside phosphorylase [Methanolobus sp.]|nr:MTAP family purine nucleoside phosphorylase [Methanolobus sp.]